MTRHNLPVQLSWLLESPHNVPAPPTIPSSANASVTLGAEPYTLSQFQSQVAGTSVPADVVVLETYGHRVGNQEFVPPLNPGKADQSRCLDEMVRLQSAAKSSNKPRLLSQALSELAATPRHHPERRSATSLGEQYNAACNRSNDGKDRCGMIKRVAC